MSNTKHAPNAPRSFPAPQLVVPAGILFAGLAAGVGPDGTAGVVLTIRNDIVAAHCPMTAEEVDATIARLTELRGELGPRLAAASAADVSALGLANGRH